MGKPCAGPLSFKAATYSGVFTLLPLRTGEGRTHRGEILAETSDWPEAGKLVPLVDPRRPRAMTAASIGNHLSPSFSSAAAIDPGVGC
jgi:hypothetical protein